MSRVLSFRLLVPEASAALARDASRTAVDEIGDEAQSLARSLLRDIALAEVDEELVDQASDLATTFVLHGYDAVHLASFERVESGESVLVAADGDLARRGERWGTQSPCRELTPASMPALVSTDLHTRREYLDDRLPELRALGTEEGSLELIVVRPQEDERQTPDAAEVTIAEGLAGDRWLATAQRRMDAAGAIDRSNQLTLMSTRVLALIAPRDRWPLSGDNLLVDMGLDAERLPAGSRLAIGGMVVIEISEEPHTGCSKFSSRFGSDALRFVNSPEGRVLRLRGANAHVVEPGRISVGDAIRRQS